MTDTTSEEYRRIARDIRSDESPVGIDAERTHVLILQKLARIERRLEAIEDRLDAKS